jgi:hypothetical protein
MTARTLLAPSILDVDKASAEVLREELAELARRPYSLAVSDRRSEVCRELSTLLYGER